MFVSSDFDFSQYNNSSTTTSSSSAAAAVAADPPVANSSDSCGVSVDNSVVLHYDADANQDQSSTPLLGGAEVVASLDSEEHGFEINDSESQSPVTSSSDPELTIGLDSVATAVR
jgi:hypothetical protein